ncbi:NAD(P)H-hydrate dehydratase [Sulfitobacter sp. D35]|uniref:NAD(P)H-hydrate dehydratase n=1 Tax=Sulfitobacter sp. D35 TaxID=3083252 RepID=UPI00296E68E9|nr:NAD(P)H-hydrate dehydratase [Sulfitobacter sp. D35]MDW4496689.1 NAD(P)H-hydrate dehydratase [Sulfitobacter sp. D35]
MPVRLVTRHTIDIGTLRKAAGHKFSHGHPLVLSGGPARTGAARLAARGALRIGAGLVTLAVPPAALQEVAAQVTAVMLRSCEDASALRALLDDRRITAICAGPGLGLEGIQEGLLAEVLAARRPTVLDADALTLLSRSPSLRAALHAHCLLTPHDGEFTRLFPGIAERLSAAPAKGPAMSRLDAAREAARDVGCPVLLKGPDTVIALPDGAASIHAASYDRAAPGLATAGAGDVLAGFIAGLLARGRDVRSAAETASWLHVECARVFGPGLIAEDLPEILPRVLRDLEA